MANTTVCVIKKCDRCDNNTRGTWRIKGYFYCYKCYRKETIDNRGLI